MIPAEYFPSADLNCGKGPKKAVSGLYFLFLEADIISSVLEEEVSFSFFLSELIEALSISALGNTFFNSSIIISN